MRLVIRKNRWRHRGGGGEGGNRHEFRSFGERHTHGYGARWNAEMSGPTDRANVQKYSKRHASLTFVSKYLRTCYLVETISTV